MTDADTPEPPETSPSPPASAPTPGATQGASPRKLSREQAKADGARKVRPKRKKAKKQTSTKRSSRKRKVSKAAASGAPATAQRGRGRPPKTPTEDQLKLVQLMAMIGMSQKKMCARLQIDEETFRKYEAEYFGPAIEKGEADLEFEVGRSLIKQIRAGNMTANIWVEKTRFGRTEKVHTIVSNPEGGPVESHVHHSGAVAIGLFLPPNGRDVPAAGQTLPGALMLPSNAREEPTA